MSTQLPNANSSPRQRGHRLRKVARLACGLAVVCACAWGIGSSAGRFRQDILHGSAPSVRKPASARLQVGITPASVSPAIGPSLSAQESNSRTASPSTKQDDDPFVKSLDWLEKASAEEKDALRRKRERFDRLPESEKERLRQFHQSLMTHPDRARLQQVLVRYDEWLRTLTPAKRAEIQDLPVDQRIAKIKEFQDEQARRALGFFGETKLPDQDVPRLYEWIDSFVAANEEMLLEKLPGDKADEIRRRARSDDWRRRRIAYELTTLELDELRDMVTVQDVETLLSTLSSEAHEILKTRSTSEDKALLVQRWIRFALMARNMYMMPKLSDEDLEKFFREELTEEEREQLDRMPPDQRKQRLEWLYRSRHSRRGSNRSDGPPPNARSFEYDLLDRFTVNLAFQSRPRCSSRSLHDFDGGLRESA